MLETNEKMSNREPLEEMLGCQICGFDLGSSVGRILLSFQFFLKSLCSDLGILGVKQYSKIGGYLFICSVRFFWGQE